MDLAKRCRDQFDSRDWSRGSEYFRTRAVAIIDQSPQGLTAKVAGSQVDPYRVRFDWSHAADGEMAVDCSCPRFDDVGICKHIAATILAADARNIGQTIPGGGRLELEPSPPDDGEDDDWEDDVWEDDDLDDSSRGRIDRGLAPWRERPSGSSRPAHRESAAPRKGGKRRQSQLPGWKIRLAALARELEGDSSGTAAESGSDWSRPRELWYLLNIKRTAERGWPCLSIAQRIIKQDGNPGKLRAAGLSQREVERIQSDQDRTLLGLLTGNERDMGFGSVQGPFSTFYRYGSTHFAIAPAMIDILLPRLCASGRFGWLADDDPTRDDRVRLLAWDDGPAWKLLLTVTKSADQKHWQLGGRLVRDGARDGARDALDVCDPLVLAAAGLAVFSDRIARYEPPANPALASILRREGPLLVPLKHEQELAECLAQSSAVPPAECPIELRWEEDRPQPLPQLTISKSKSHWETNLECRLAYGYGDRVARFGQGPAAWYDRQTRRVLRRDFAAERSARDRLLSAGARRATRSSYGRQEPGLFSLAPQKMPRLVLDLTAAGWRVEAEGRLIRRAGAFAMSVTSGVDWFDLTGTCDFGDGHAASLPRLLAALRSGERYVRLDDGSQGMLPDEWLARFAAVADMGQADGERIRFRPTQAALLDALLAGQEKEPVALDKTFTRFRDKLRSFEGIEPREEPKSFVGELRHYQREGLGWLHFLDEFAFGGCLADDMGLGKTVQILALLDERRQVQSRRGRKRKGHAETGPRLSLVVVPRSLVFNWIEEAGRFTPGLRVLNYTGLDRDRALDKLPEHDLVVTTYGTLRRDIARLRDCEFDYAILDEAQAVKNASSQAAKACRLLRARRRLAMTGTPVENHLGELWSLFEFLNPGMLGRHRKLNELAGAGRRGRRSNGEAENGREPGNDLALLARALRPFLLRRTKQQVLSELPAKTEQTLYCELGDTERALYEELRAHYRQSLLSRVDKVGLKKSKIHVLEALLRLRQAACHPGLLDRQKVDAESSKLETLLEQLTEVIDEGHKALVFSQFTSLLAIVRKQLDQRSIVYEYLDGRTVNRQQKVERFQTDPDCRLFLISLKAGGQGLNLTAADYVFILDPWWNPAVEAQAVDRAHRIGQERRVFAYRLIARNTVEEKIVQLQQEKRGLAEAIVSADNSILRNLTAEDLQILLS